MQREEEKEKEGGKKKSKLVSNLAWNSLERWRSSPENPSVSRRLFEQELLGFVEG